MLLANLYRRVVTVRDSIPDVRVREQVGHFIRNGEKFFTLEDAAAAAALVGVSFGAMLRGAANTPSSAPASGLGSSAGGRVTTT